MQLATNNYVFVVRRTTLRIQEYLQKFIPQQDTGNSTNVAVDEFNVKVLRSELIRLSVAPCKLFSSMTLCLFLNPDFKLFFCPGGSKVLTRVVSAVTDADPWVPGPPYSQIHTEPMTGQSFAKATFAIPSHVLPYTGWRTNDISYIPTTE